ncbi:HNH endonuclease [Sutcliffiella halmapala]
MKRVNLFYQSSAWIKKRDRILRRDLYECRECRRYGKIKQATTVHHIYPLELYPEYKLATNNLLSLCSNCHNEMHDRVTNELTDKGNRWKERTLLPPTPSFYF